MKKKIHISSNLKFDTSIITEVIDLIAKRGSGKTYAATKLAEEMILVGAQVVVVDPVGNWYGLRLGADGKSSGGVDIKIIGGRNGDIPIEYTAGKVVAKTIVETGMSVILDVSMLPKAKQRRFITDFSVELLECRKRDPSAMHIFWEEAYRFMPQKMAKGSKNEMLEATEDLVTMGRNFGIGGTIVAQRSAQISKTVLTQASILFAMNTTGLADRKLIESWVEYHSIDMEPMELSSLKKGEAYVWWPEEFGIRRIQVGKKSTFDASSTPKFGEKSRKRKLKNIDLQALKVSMSETIEKVIGEDPRILKRRIAELEKDKSGLQKDIASLEFDLEHSTKQLVVSDSQLESLERSVDAARHTLNGLLKALSLAACEPINKVRTRPKAVAPVRPTRSTISESSASSGAPFPPGALRMLKSLAAIYPGGMTKKQVATAAKMKSTSGTFGTYWSRLNVEGVIREGGGRWYATDSGIDHLGVDMPEQPNSPEEKLEFWCERLSGRSRELLRYLFDNSSHGFTKLELGEAVGLSHTSGTFGTYLSALTSNGLATRNGGEYRISDEILVA